MPTYSGSVYDNTGAAVGGRIVRAYRRDTGALLGASTTSNGTVTPGDPLFANVALLLPLNGSVGGTSFVDASPTPKAITVAGTVSVSNEQTLFGGNVAKFSGGASALLASSSEFSMGNGPYTMEAWMYLLSDAAGGFGNLTQSGEVYHGTSFWMTGAGAFRSRNGRSVAGGFSDTMGSGSLPIGSWFHVATCHNGSTTDPNRLKIWISGALNAQGGADFPVNLEQFAVGRAYPNSALDGLNGYMSNMRVTVGAARYDSPFTPPTAPFPTSSGSDPGPLGSYSISTTYSGEVQVVCLDDDAGPVFNDKIYRVLPA